jgi:HrpA-like RNA helicase
MFTNLINTLAHLPVMQIAHEVALEFSQSANKSIPIIKAPVASGKTLLLPAVCSNFLYEHFTAPNDDNVIVVLTPNRNLALNATETMRKILGPQEEDLVGCLMSTRSNERSIVHDDNRIIFTTVGYALASGMLDTYNNFIIDEAHETTIDLSIAKAYLDKRIREGSEVGLMIMSATMNDTSEVEYWGGDIAKVFTTESSAFPVQLIHTSTQTIAQATFSLIAEHNRKGILVFVAGKTEIDTAIIDISSLLDECEIDYEICSLFGRSDYEERELAYADPTKDVKILVATNVIESGVNIPWVDGGVSSGKTKIMNVYNNIHRLVEEDLPIWRIEQQAGRVRRFKPGVFILADKNSFKNRDLLFLPDIRRLPLTELVMHVASLPDTNIDDLRFAHNEQPNPRSLSTAIHLLEQYGLVEQDVNGVLSLTDDGIRTKNLPLTFRASTAFCEAVNIGMESRMIPLVVMMEMGDIRFRFNEPVTGTQCRYSDIVNYTIKAIEYFFIYRNEGKEVAYDFARNSNLNVKKLNEFINVVKDLEHKLGILSDFSFYLNHDTPQKKEYFDKAVKRVLFRANLHELYRGGITAAHVSSLKEALFSKHSVIGARYSERSEYISFSGSLRDVSPKDKWMTPFTVLENITAFTEGDFDYLINEFGEARLKKMLPSMEHSRVFEFYFTKKENDKKNGDQSKFQSYVDDAYTDFQMNGQSINRTPTKTVGSFGDVLKKAMGR